MLLADTGVVRGQGSVDAGTTLLDASAEARALRQTVEISAAWVDLADGRFLGEERPCVVQLLDTPGATFLASTRDLALSSADGVLLAVDAVDGLQLGTEEAIRAAAELRLPVIAVLTRLDRGLDGSVVDALSVATGLRAVLLHLPIQDGDRLVGLVDVLAGRVLRYGDDGGGAVSPEPLSGALLQEHAVALERLAEAVAVTDDALLEHYLEYLALPADLLRDGLARAVRSRALLPVCLTSAALGIGGGPLLAAVADWMPGLGEIPRQVVDYDGSTALLSPDGPFVARVLSEQVDADGETWHLLRILSGRPPRGDWFTARNGDRHRVRKLYRIRGPRRSSAPDPQPGSVVGTWDPLPVGAGSTLTDGQRFELMAPEARSPMVGRAIRYVRPDDPGRVDPLLQSLVRGDRGLALHADESTGALLLAGTDETHLRLAQRKLARYGAEIQLELPPVGYVETPLHAVRGVEGLHRKTDHDGLVEEFGRCEVALEPMDPLDGARFVDAIGDGEDDLPMRYRPAIDEGARSAMLRGPTAGYPVVGVELSLTGGDYDLLQSTDDHFRVAGHRAARTALERVGTRLLEPWWEVEVDTPQQVLGDVISDIAAHRGRILGMEVEGGRSVLVAACPYRELRTFGSRLQAISGGRGWFRGRESHYEPLPAHLVAEVVQTSPWRRPPAPRGT